MGSFSLVAERNHTHTQKGVVASFLLLRRFWGYFWRYLGDFCSFGGCCWETHRLFFVFRPRGLLGAAGTKIVAAVAFGGAVLWLFMAVPGPSHMHGTAATQAGSGLPRQASAAIALAVVSPNLNFPTYVLGGVGG